MDTLQRLEAAPELNHFRPVIRYSSPSRTMRVRMLVASELATSGSVIEKQDRISPSSNGASQVSFCSGVPNRWRISMFPVSGAEQLMASGAISGSAR